MGRFSGRVALITGAASGIGSATATRMAADGATIVGFDRDVDGLTSVAAEISEAGGTMTTVAGDVSVRTDCIAAVDAAFSTTLLISQGARNCPFFKLTGRPV